jgi:hypothetical protein
VVQGNNGADVMDYFSYSIDLMELCSRKLIYECYTESFKYLCVVEWMRDVEKRQFVLALARWDSFLLLSGREFESEGFG